MSAGAEQAAEEPGNEGISAVGAPGTADIDGLRRPVPDQLIPLLAEWTQGMYVDRVPAVWAGPDAPDPLFDADVIDIPEITELIDIAVGGPSGMFAHTVITSQTCDAVGTGPGAKHPYVQVSPVVRLPDDLPVDKLGQIDRYEIPYLAPVSQRPGRSRTGRWAVDLRLSVPVSKSALAARPRRLAFASDHDAVAFARHAARKTERPALHDALSEALPRSIGEWIKQYGKKDVAWWQNVEQLRLRITGDRLRPRAAALVVLAETELAPEQEARWRDWQARFAKDLLKEHNIVLEPVQFTSLDELPARQFTDTLWLRVPELKRLQPAF